MQPHPLTSVMQLSVTVAAIVIAACIAAFTVLTWKEKRNADLVGIGVGVLRVDPEKEKQIGAAREWALDLIDANAGGVTFSHEARQKLLKQPLGYIGTYGYGGSGGFLSSSSGTYYDPTQPPLIDPANQPPQNSN